LYALNEQYMDIQRNLLVAISIAIGVATCVMYVMLNDTVTTLVCAAVLTLIQLELYGALYWLDMKLNPVSFINLVTTTGVSVEIVAHMARAYSVATEPDRTSRALRAFTTMAPALANGAFTTFLGISPVAFSNYAYFVKYFWLQWCVMLAVSLTHGIVLAPILLSLIGGETGVEKDAIATIDCDGVDTHDHP
jgi:Niemann-Pick C1 protein